ncbi:L-lactate dehydrogenase (cytochrome) [Delftia acidovorans CCUG 274B]|nr:L-lactate dehydrogenase (cytochrome) [Delftia acidovorans CCUG 274B]
MREEVLRDMAMLGATRLDQVTPACVRHAQAWDAF